MPMTTSRGPWATQPAGPSFTMGSVADMTGPGVAARRLSCPWTGHEVAGPIRQFDVETSRGWAAGGIESRPVLEWGEVSVSYSSYCFWRRDPCPLPAMATCHGHGLFSLDH